MLNITGSVGILVNDEGLMLAFHTTEAGHLVSGNPASMYKVLIKMQLKPSLS